MLLVDGLCPGLLSHSERGGLYAVQEFLLGLAMFLYYIFLVLIS